MLIYNLERRIASQTFLAQDSSHGDRSEQYTSINVPEILQALKEKTEVTAKGILKDTILPLLVEILKGVGSLNWAALGFSMLAWGIDRLDKQHENFEDCLFLLKNTLFLLRHTKNMWVKNETMGSQQLLQSNLPRIVEVALKASLICDSCGLNYTDEQTTKTKRYVDMARTFLGAASLEASIGKLKEQVRDLILQNGLAVQETILRKLQNSNVRRQLSGYKTLPQNYRPDMTDEIQKMLGVSTEEIIAVCIHGMGGVGKSTLALHVLNSFNNGTQQRRLACSRVVFELHLKINKVEKEITRLQNQILKDISNDLDVEGKLSNGDISDASDGRERPQRAFQKSRSNPILLYIDNVHQQQHLVDLLPNVNHLPSGSTFLVTTRNEHIRPALRKLGVKNDRCHSIPLEKLGVQESRAMLRTDLEIQKENKGIIDNDETLKDLECQLLQLCDGLPLALSLMGRYIAYSQNSGGAESAETWRYVVKAMKEGKSVGAERDDPLYGRLRVSSLSIIPLFSSIHWMKVSEERSSIW